MEQLISEMLKPAAGSFDLAAMAIGEPGLPKSFEWRGQRHDVVRVLDRWKESAPCTHGSSERYLRKHWYVIDTSTGLRMTIYFERQARRGGNSRQRWWLFTIQDDGKTG